MLQEVFYCHVSSATGAHRGVSNVEFGKQVMPEFTVACSQSHHDNLLFSGELIVAVSGVVVWVLLQPLSFLFFFYYGFGLSICDRMV